MNTNPGGRPDPETGCAYLLLIAAGMVVVYTAVVILWGPVALALILAVSLLALVLLLVLA